MFRKSQPVCGSGRPHGLRRGFKRTVAAWRRNSSGNVAIMTSISALMLVVGVGAAVDYTKASARENDIQNLADMAVLAAASAKDKEPAELQSMVESLIAEHNTQGLPLDVQVTVVDNVASLTVRSVYNTKMMGMVGRKAVPVSVNARSPLRMDQPVNIALVLDATRSMEGDNIAALRVAANTLVDAMEDVESEVNIAVVPFGEYVNVGVDKGIPTPRSWIDMGRYGQTHEHCYTPRVVIQPATCVTTGTETYDRIVDGVNMGVGTRDTRECTGGISRPGDEEICETRTIGWHGCMGSRQGNHAERVGVDGHRLPAALGTRCGSVMRPLSTNYPAIREDISNLTTAGNTYLPSGLMWGWRALDPAEPFPEARAIQNRLASRGRNRTIKNALVFMTDGANVLARDHNGPLHRDRDGEKGLEMTETLCNGIKDDGIEIFVVAYRLAASENREKTLEVLSDCATSPGHYFEPGSARALNEAFGDVANMMQTTMLVP